MKVLGANGKQLTADEVELAKSLGSTKGAVSIKVQCPVCDTDVVAELTVGQKSRRLKCSQCGNKLLVSIDGSVTAYGPNGKSPSQAENLAITEEHMCGDCRFYSYMKESTAIALGVLGGVAIAAVIGFGGYKLLDSFVWPIIAVVVSVVAGGFVGFLSGVFLLGLLMDISNEGPRCNNKNATSVTGKTKAADINLVCRCRFWKK